MFLQKNLLTQNMCKTHALTCSLNYKSFHINPIWQNHSPFKSSRRVLTHLMLLISPGVCCFNNFLILSLETSRELHFWISFTLYKWSNALAKILCCLHSLKEGWEMARCVYIWLEIRIIFPMPLSYMCSAGFKGPCCTPFSRWTGACSLQTLSPKMSAMRRDDTAATHTIWWAPLLNTFMLCLENTDKLTWIQDDSKHRLSLRYGVGEDGSELADIGLCFALIWGFDNCSVSHKAAPNEGL